MEHLKQKHINGLEIGKRDILKEKGNRSVLEPRKIRISILLVGNPYIKVALLRDRKMEWENMFGEIIFQSTQGILQMDNLTVKED